MPPVVPSRLRELGAAPEPDGLVRLRHEHRVAESRLREQIQALDACSWQYDRFYDGTFGYLGGRAGGYGYPADRAQDQSHAPLPYLTEPEWRLQLALARDLLARNHIAIGICDQLAAFIGPVTVQFVRTGHAPGSTDVGPVDADGFGRAEGDPDAAEAQAAWDEFCEINSWGPEFEDADREAECARRLISEGECTLQFFRGGRGEAPLARHVEPELIRTPTEIPREFPWATSMDWRWGLLTAPNDAERVLAMYVADPDLSGGRVVMPDRFARTKGNADRSVKRGLSDFFCVEGLVRKVASIQENMAHCAKVLAAILWWEQHPTWTEDTVRRQIETGRDYQVVRPNGMGPSAGPNARTADVKTYDPGSIIKTEFGRQVVPPPTAVNTANLLQLDSAILRSVGFRFGFPAAFVAGEPTESFAGVLVSGSPLVTRVTPRQAQKRGFTRGVVARVLRLCEESGRLKPGTRDRVKPVMTSPPIVIADEEKQSRTFLSELQAGVADPYAYMKERGHDPKVLLANLASFKKKQAEMGTPQGAAPQPGAPTDPTATPPGSAGGDGSSPNPTDVFGESKRVKEEGQPPFPGAVFDRTVHRWKKPDQSSPAAKTNPNTAPTGAAPKQPRTQADPPPARFGATATGRVLIGADVQRWAEGTNEPAVAKEVGGKALPDNEPMDVVLPPPPDAPAHGLELKTMVANAHRQIHMGTEAQSRKRAWRRKNGVPVHTVVIDDTAVYNANGPGQHNLSKRRVFYRRGFGSFKVDGMHEVAGGIAGLKALVEMPTRKLPPGAWKPKKPAATESRVAEHGSPPWPGAVLTGDPPRWHNPHTGETAPAEPAKSSVPTDPHATEPPAEFRAAADQLVNLSKEPLSQDKRDEYAAALARVLYRMPPASRNAALLALKGAKVAFHESTAEIKAASEALTKTKEKGEVAGFVAYRPHAYDRVELHLDGAGAGNTAEGVYAHELGHLVGVHAGQRTGERPEDDPKWVAAWTAEISNKRPATKQGISRYAATSAKEGWAELYRHVHEKGIDATRAAFPRCAKFLESKGLLK